LVAAAEAIRVRRRLTNPWVILGAAFGFVIGLGLFTFHYAEGTSYLSNDPKACVNCHIMQDQYDSWQTSSHHAIATCNDCHVPHDLIGKYIAKAENGYHHSKGFTFQDFHEPIQIKAKNARILQENCLRCHAQFVHDIVDTHGPSSLSCVHCHADVGHSGHPKGARVLSIGR
jgi:cytochrome c nitrite reductase small subunit